MLKFRQFISLKEEDTSKVERTTFGRPNGRNPNTIPAVILNPDRDMIRKKETKKKLNEETLHGKAVDPEIENHLKELYSKEFFSKAKEKKNVRAYTEASFGLNGHLLGAHHTSTEPDMKPSFGGNQYDLHALDSVLTRRPVGRKMTVYSGLGFDPREQTSRSGHIHLPSYTSTTIDPSIAKNFSGEYAPRGQMKHVMKIDLNEGDTGAYIAGHSKHKKEKEFLLPRATTLRIHKSEPDENNPNLMIHHAVIDNNVDPNNIERHPTALMGLHRNFHSSYAGEKSNSRIADIMRGHAENAVGQANNFSEVSKMAAYLPRNELVHHTKRILKSGQPSTEELKHIAKHVNDSEVHEAIMSRKNTNGEVMHSILDHKYIHPKVAQKIMNHPDVAEEHLSKIARGTTDPEIHRQILDHPKANSTTATSVAYSSDNDEVHHKIIDGPHVDSMSLFMLAAKAKSPDVQRKIINHPETHTMVLDQLARHTEHPDIQKQILNHPKAASSTLANSILPRSNGPLSHETLNSVLDHPKVTPAIARSVALKTDNEELKKKAEQKAIQSSPEN